MKANHGATSDAVKVLPVIVRPPNEYWLPKLGSDSYSFVHSIDELSM